VTGLRRRQGFYTRYIGAESQEDKRPMREGGRGLQGDGPRLRRVRDRPWAELKREGRDCKREGAESLRAAKRPWAR